MRPHWVLSSLIVGLSTGVIIMVSVNVPVYHFGNWPDDPRDYFGFWGVFFGAFSVPFAFGLALAVFRREVLPRQAVGHRPVAWSSVVAGVVGLAVMAAVNIPVYNSGQWPDHGREILGFWGALFGLGTSLLTFVISRKKLRRAGGAEADYSQIERTRNAVGLLISALVAGLFGLVVTWWNAMWGIPPLSLEGAWLWPLAIVPLVVSFLLFRSYRRRSRSR